MLSNNPDFELVNNAYPMFGANISREWGTPALVTYLKGLIQDARLGERMNVSDTVMSALSVLTELHNRTYPEFILNVESDENYRTIAESFPRISAKIVEYWGCKEFGPFVSELLHDNRGSNRKGFPFETLMAIESLVEQHNQFYGHLYPSTDIWMLKDV